MPDPTNPDHYKRLDPEPIDVIEKWNLGFCTGNAVKYLARAGYKPGADQREDLAKALWYVERALRRAGVQTSAATLATATTVELLERELETVNADARQWRGIAKALADRVRELTGGPPVSEPDRALELYRLSCIEGGSRG